MVYIASSLAPYVLQQSTSSLVRIFLTYIPFTSSLLLYYLYCRSLYPYQLHISVLHLFTAITSTLTFYGFQLPPLHHTALYNYKGPDQNVSYTTPMPVYPPNKDTCLHHYRAITDVLKGQILEARGLRLMHDEISEELDIPQSTVASFL